MKVLIQTIPPRSQIKDYQVPCRSNQICGIVSQSSPAKRLFVFSGITET